MTFLKPEEVLALLKYLNEKHENINFSYKFGKYNYFSIFDIKGTLMQIRKSDNIFVFIWK